MVYTLVMFLKYFIILFKSFVNQMVGVNIIVKMVVLSLDDLLTDKYKENSSLHILIQLIIMDKFIMEKLLVITDNIIVHNFNILVVLKIVFIMAKEKYLEESILFKVIGLKVKYKVVNFNGLKQIIKNTNIKVNSIKTYKCMAKVN